MASFWGPLLVLTFCLSQAFRDVYFGHLFQGVDFFAVIVVAFLASTVIFTALTALRTPGEFAKLRGNVIMVVAMNVATAIAWVCYFYGLTHLEPSIVNTVHSGMAPLTVVVLGACGVRLAKREAIGAIEYLCYGGIALSLVSLAWVALAGKSGLSSGLATGMVGVLAAFVSGTSITLSLLYSKRLHDHGINAEAVTAARYPLLVVLAGCVMAFRGVPSGIGGADGLALLTVAATILIVLPAYALQEGVARTTPLTAQVIRTLGPVFIFALEQVDHRLHYSAATLAWIVAYSAFGIAGNIAHGWRDQAPAAATPH